MNKKVWPNRLRECRKRLLLTQEDVSKLMGLKSFDRICRWEHGTSYPSAKNLMKLSKILGVSVEELYDSVL